MREHKLKHSFQGSLNLICRWGPSIKNVRTLGVVGGEGGGGGEGVRQKWTNADRGRGWLAKCGRPLGKKIIATIFVKLTQIIWQYVCI